MADKARTLLLDGSERAVAYQEIGEYFVANPVAVLLVQFFVAGIASADVVGLDTMIRIEMTTGDGGIPRPQCSAANGRRLRLDGRGRDIQPRPLAHGANEY